MSFHLFHIAILPELRFWRECDGAGTSGMDTSTGRAPFPNGSTGESNTPNTNICSIVYLKAHQDLCVCVHM